MVSGKIQKMYSVVSFNESRSELSYTQLTQSQLGLLFPFYIVGILVKGLSHLLSVDGKFKKYSFSYMTIDSKNCLAVKIDHDLFTKLFPEGSFKVLTKIRETEVEQVVPSSKTSKKSPSRGSKATLRIIHRGSAQIPASSPNISNLVYCKRIFNYPYNDNYSLMFRPKTLFTRA